MGIAELATVRKMSKSPNSPAWQNWENRMYAKAVLKRALTSVQDDPVLSSLIEHDNKEFDVDKIIEQPKRSLESITEEIYQPRIEQQEEAETLSDRSPDEMSDEEISYVLDQEQQ